MGSGNFAGWYVVVYGVSGAVMGNLYEIDVGGGWQGWRAPGGRGTCDKLITEVVRSGPWVLELGVIVETIARLWGRRGVGQGHHRGQKRWGL